jgi:hypothetical protein
MKTTDTLTSADHWVHIQARLGINRMLHRVKPGLYALGEPAPDSPVFVTANYQLSFDALRASLKGMHAYILVLDTRGINVWCAAGKGTFGTDELVKRIELTHLKDVVKTRVLILPQLGATGIAAHEVKKRTGFKVEYGPVRAADVPEYMKTRKATTEMRRVRFTLLDRMILVPVEMLGYALPTLVASVVLYFLGGWFSVLALVAAVLAGVVLFPILLPWLPFKDFSVKGFVLGLLVMLPFIIISLATSQDALWLRLLKLVPLLLGYPVVTSFIALNFTGSSTFTSVVGVKNEIYAYIPLMAWFLGISVVLTIGFTVAKALGG